MILNSSTSPLAALEAGKRLIGQWPHSKPADPETYAASIGAVLAQYPLGLVRECVDPRVGLARGREFPPTIAAVVEWCDQRLEHHRTLAAWRPPALPPRELPDDPVMAARARALFDEVVATFRDRGLSPLDRMHEEVAQARRLRIEEVMRRAEEPARATQEQA